LRVVVMGCGGSGGVPFAGNYWGVCNPDNPKNRRTRPSIYIEQGDTRIVIDTGPDFRQQINAVGGKAPLSAVLYTHEHADHINGMDDLRAFWYQGGKIPVDCYVDKSKFDILTQRFSYVIASDDERYPSSVKLHAVTPDFKVNHVRVQSFDTYHDRSKQMVVTGYRIGDFGYTTDATILTEDAFKILKGIKIWVVGIHDNPDGGHTHPSLDEVIAWNAKIGAEKIYITHMAAGTDYDELMSRSPDYIEPAYDGLEFIL
ncbi:MAG TPA: MBL fold metallo-hydrolase, partial [Alphaproteobacteria bacterium]